MEPWGYQYPYITARCLFIVCFSRWAPFLGKQGHSIARDLSPTGSPPISTLYPYPPEKLFIDTKKQYLQLKEPLYP